MSVSEWFKIITYISPIVMAIGVAIGVFFYRHLGQRDRVVFFYILASLLVDIFSRVLPYLLSERKNLFVIPIWALLELSIFFLLFRRSLHGTFGASIKIFSGLTLCILIYEIAYMASDFSPGNYSYYGKLLCNFSIILMALNGIRIGLKDIKSSSLDFLFNGITLGFYLLNLIIFASINFLTGASLRIVTVFWLFNIFTIVVYQIFLSYYLWQNGKTQKSLQYG